MKKRLLCSIFAVLMLVGLAACGDKGSTAEPESSGDGFDSFKEVQANMQDVKDMAFTMDMKMSVPDQEAMNMSMSGTGQEIIKSKDDIEMKMDSTMNMAGTGDTNLKATMYLKDKTIYMDLMGQKMKMPMDDEMASMMQMNTNQLLEISEDVISDLQVSQDGDNKVFNIKLDANKALDYFSKNAGTAGSLAGTAGDVKISKMDLTVTADKDNMLRQFHMDCSMDVKSNEETMSMDYQLSMKDIKVNTGLKIDFPDFSGYQEMSE